MIGTIIMDQEEEQPRPEVVLGGRAGMPEVLVHHSKERVDRLLVPLVVEGAEEVRQLRLRAQGQRGLVGLPAAQLAEPRGRGRGAVAGAGAVALRGLGDAESAAVGLIYNMI